jgi:hypothetical protein
MIHFCTYFDSNYLIKGLALYRSLVRHAMPFRLWVLCFDDLVHEALQKAALAGITAISLRDFEEGDQELLQAKSNRSRIEYYFTCTPSLLLHVLRNHGEVDVITYLDADLFFFSDASPVYQELDKGSVLIVRHRFPPALKHLQIHGIYNVGLVSFRRDDVGFQCLQWWRDRCLEWCCDRVEDGRFADQKYLDDWPVRFPRVVVLQHKGAGLAPWNVDNYSLRLEDGQILIDSQPLVFFHFHRLERTGRWLYDPDLGRYGAHASSLLRKYIYGSYIRELHEAARCAASFADPAHVRLGSIRDTSPQVRGRRSILFTAVRRAQHHVGTLQRVLHRDLWIVIAGRVL